jgi:hypothetical protein
MLSTLAKRLLWLGSLTTLVAALAVFTSAGFAQDPQDPAKAAVAESHSTADVDLDHLENYIGQEVTLMGDIDHVYSPTAFRMEAKGNGKDHVLVIAVMPEAKPAEVKEGKDIMATGMIRSFNREALEKEFGSIDWGTTPFDKFEGKPILVMGKAAETPVVQLEKPSPEPVPAPVTEPAPTPAPEPAPTVTPRPEPQAAPAPAPEEKLPRTATPLPLIGLSGLLSLAAGLSTRLFRR